MAQRLFFKDPELEWAIAEQKCLDRERELDRVEAWEQAMRQAEVTRVRCKSLVNFVREAWAVLEPDTPYVHNWHIDAICAHLEAVTRGEITRLLINVPPGPMRHDSIVETARGPILLSSVRVGDMALTHRGRYRLVSAVHHQGVLPILKITTNSGRITNAAPSHPYLTPRGWVDAKDLRPGDRLAIVNRAEDRPNSPGIGDAEARLLGYLVGDGSLTQATAGFTNGDRDVVDDFRRCAAEVGFETTETFRKTHWQVRVLGGQKVRAWLNAHGLLGCSSYAKRIPEAIMCGNRESLANFIGAYWTCDGGFDVRPTAARGSIFRAYGTTVSEGLAADLLYALGMLGIDARLRRKSRTLETAAQPGGRYTSFSLEVQNEAMAARFAALPGLCTTKRLIAERCRQSFDRPLWDDPIISIEPQEDAECMCLTVEEDHSFVCSGIAVKNSMKSLLVSVLWPAWEWGPAEKPGMRYLPTSFSEVAVSRDTQKMRDLVESDWYQLHWPEVRLKKRGETNITNSKRGGRRGVPFGSLTSQRGDRLIIDDPHSTELAESDKERAKTTRKFREGALNRLNDQVRSAIVVIMQRLHEADISGVILLSGMKYVHLMLPMEFEIERTCKTKWFEDPRTVDGELLDPKRFPREVVDRELKAADGMGAYAYAGQYQQRPSPREGGMFQREWFKNRVMKPNEVPGHGITWVRHWDLAATERKKIDKTGARTASVRMGIHTDGRIIISSCIAKNLSGAKVRVLIKATAAADGRSTMVSLPQDPGQAGKVQKGDNANLLQGFNVRFLNEGAEGNKVERAEPFSAQCEVENVWLVEGGWNVEFLDELCLFPGGARKDIVDACSGAYARLTFGRRRAPKGVSAPEIITTKRTSLLGFDDDGD